MKEFVEISCRYLDIPLEWRGEGEGMEGFNPQTGKTFVAVDPRYFRPAEVETLLGDPTEAEKVLGWKPTISFQDLVKEMAEEDLRLAERERERKNGGYGA